MNLSYSISKKIKSNIPVWMAKSSLFCYKKDKEMINEIIVINEKDINVTRYVSSCQEFLLS